MRHAGISWFGVGGGRRLGGGGGLLLYFFLRVCYVGNNADARNRWQWRSAGADVGDGTGFQSRPMTRALLLQRDFHVVTIHLVRARSRLDEILQTDRPREQRRGCGRRRRG